MAKRLLYFLPVLIFVVISAYFVWGLVWGPDPRTVPSAMIDKPVPEFDLPPVAGMDLPGLATADLLTGEVTLVNIFASWCIPCRIEHPQLMKLAEDPAIRLMGIDFRDTPEAAVQFLTTLGNPYRRIGFDARGRTAIDWGSAGVPETFVIDRAGRIRYQHIGPIHANELADTILPLIERLSQ